MIRRVAKLRFSHDATVHLVDIAKYVHRETRSRDVARQLVGRIRERCSKLASLPGTLGRARPELREDIRSVAEGNYVIFFRYDGDVLEVVAVLEGHRDIDSHFGDAGPG